MGSFDGFILGVLFGLSVEAIIGLADGLTLALGNAEAFIDGPKDGGAVGSKLGNPLCNSVGDSVGSDTG